MNLDGGGDGRLLYQRVAEDIEAKILNGTIGPGEKIPTIRKLSDEYGVAPMTIQSALRVLRRSGLIVSWQGRGSYARTTHSTPPVTSDPGVSYDDLVCRIDTLTEMMNRLGDRLARVEKQLASSS